MSGDVRRFAARSIQVSVMVALMVPAYASGLALALAAAGSSGHARCEPWLTGASGRVGVAWAPGAMVAVDVPVDVSECVLPSGSPEDEATPSLVRFLEQMGIERLHVVSDRGDDLLTLTGDPVAGTIDDALRVEELRFGSGVVRRDDLAGIVRFIERGRIDDLHPVFGGAPADLMQRGRWQFVLLDTMGDPSVPADMVRTWELGLADEDPGRNVPLLAGTGNPYSGVRQVLTYAQVPVEGGGFEGRLGRTDLGSDALGPDGQTRFYNARPNFAAFASEDGVGFLLPEELDPIGFRAWARGGGSDAWDLVQGPGGPLALVPTDGSWAGMLDLFLPIVVHEALTMPATIDGEAQPAHGFPSHLNLILGVPTLDPDTPLTLDLGYLTGDTRIRFEDLEARPLGDGLFGAQVGLTTYGLHAFEELVIDELGDLPEGWDELSEGARMLGWAFLMVGEEEGPIHGSLVRPWLTGEGAPLRHPYDPDIMARLLDGAGSIPVP